MKIIHYYSKLFTSLPGEDGIGGFAKELRALQSEIGNVGGDLSAKLGGLELS